MNLLTKDVVIRLFRAARQRRTESSTKERRIQIFDAVVYTYLPLQLNPVPDRFPYSVELASLPAAGVEQITIETADYESDLASFIEGEQSMQRMRDRLLQMMSSNLRTLLTNPQSDIRIWWSSSTPELEDFPWELSAGSGLQRSFSRVVFLRGIPPATPIPAIPVAGEPRLAIVGRSYALPGWARSLATQYSEHVNISDKPLREGLEAAVQAGFELIHVFADGVVSSAFDGILYDHDAPRRMGDDRRNLAELHPGELSRMLSDSRVAVLALSRSEHTSPDLHYVGGRQVLSAFRAFAYLGACTFPLPTTVVELGPVPGGIMASFWQRFYEELVPNWHLTNALRSAQSSQPFAPPIALFCRHAGGKLFRQASSADVSQPMRIRQDFLRSEQLTRDLSSLTEQYKDLPDTILRLLKNETSRQLRLKRELDTWTDREEEL
jgi:hypothetical protein